MPGVNENQSVPDPVCHALWQQQLIPGLVHREQLPPALSRSTCILLVGSGSGFDFTQLSLCVMLH